MINADLLRVTDVDSGQTLGDRVGVARSSLARLKGLLGRDRLEAGEGLLITDSPSIHMVGMRFAIDAVFIDEPDADGVCRVTKVAADLPRHRGVVWWARGAKHVIELPAGTARRSGTVAGNRLQLRAA